MALKTVLRVSSSIQPTPAAYKTGRKQPLLFNTTPPETVLGVADRYTAAQNNTGTSKRQHAFAADVNRVPVQAVRCQDADPNANVGVTITMEGATKVAHPGSSLK